MTGIMITMDVTVHAQEFFQDLHVSITSRISQYVLPCVVTAMFYLPNHVMTEFRTMKGAIIPAMGALRDGDAREGMNTEVLIATHHVETAI